LVSLVVSWHAIDFCKGWEEAHNRHCTRAKQAHVPEGILIEQPVNRSAKAVDVLLWAHLKVVVVVVVVTAVSLVVLMVVP
jgi:hypothetical protein